jgi:hypothetical protein
MPCRASGALGALVLLAALTQVSSGCFSQNSVRRIIPRYFGPIRHKIQRGDGTAQTTNWSGYALVGSTFQWVAGSWIVPASNCSAQDGNTFGTFWVGLDGYNSPTVEQIGTLSYCAGATPFYYVWYEFYPLGMVIVTSVPIQPGDRVSASVVYYSSIQEFTVRVKDDTTGETFGTSATVPGATRSSAEWIAEAPCCTASGGILPLTDFGIVPFGQDSTGVGKTNYAKNTSTMGPIGSFPPVETIEIDKMGSSSSPQTSTCSPLSSDGSSFSCAWAP